MVEQIEELDPAFETIRLFDDEIFQKGEIGIRIPRTTEEVSSFIPIRSDGRNWKLRCRENSCADVCLSACRVGISVCWGVREIIVISVRVIVSAACFESINVIIRIERRLKRRRWCIP